MNDFNREQVKQLLRPVNPNRVVSNQHTKPHLSQQDVVAHLIRVFGFGHFDVEVRESQLLFEEPTTNKGGSPAWSVGYRALVRLTVRDENQEEVAHFDGGSTGESEGQPSRADSHDLAYKSALSTATKRAAIHLGDQFGLSLYNKGQMDPLVKGTMVGVPLREDGGDMQDGVAKQEEDGGAVADRQDADAEAPQEEPTKTRATPTRGRQGTKRKAAPVDLPPAETPEPAPEMKPEPEPLPDPETVAQMAAEAEERAQFAAEADARQAEQDAADKAAAASVGLARNADALEGETEVEYQQRKLAERATAKAATAENTARPFVDTHDGATYATQEELDAVLAARVKAKQAERAAATPEAPSEPQGAGEPTAYDLAVSEFPDDYSKQEQAAATEDELRDLYNRVNAAGPMSTELRFAIMSHKARLAGPVEARE